MESCCPELAANTRQSFHEGSHKIGEGKEGGGGGGGGGGSQGSSVI